MGVEYLSIFGIFSIAFQLGLWMLRDIYFIYLLLQSVLH